MINELRKIASSASWLSFTPDMTDDFLEALSCIMLAQARECCHEMWRSLLTPFLTRTLAPAPGAKVLLREGGC